MSHLDYDDLRQRMGRLEKAAFDEYQRHFRDLIRQRCLDFGYAPPQAEIEAEKCLFAIGLRAVKQADQIPHGRFKLWVLMEVRSLLFSFWRDQPSVSKPSTTIRGVPKGPAGTTPSTWEIARQMELPVVDYQQISQRFGLPPGWLKRQHHRLASRVAQCGKKV